MELCLRPGGWLSALARLFAAEDPAPQSRAQARPEVNARAEKLLDAYGNLLLRYAYSYLHNMADAEEVLQDTLVQFLKTAPVFLNKAHEKAWLLRGEAAERYTLAVWTDGQYAYSLRLSDGQSTEVWQRLLAGVRTEG